MTPSELFALDVAVAERVMGWKVFTLEQLPHGGNEPRPHCIRVPTPTGRDALKVFTSSGDLRWFLPSENIADAWIVVEKMRESHPTFSLRWSYRYGVNGWLVQAEHNEEFAGGVTAILHGYFGATAPETICRAALNMPDSKA